MEICDFLTMHKVFCSICSTTVLLTYVYFSIEQVLIQYIGDERVAKDFAHDNQKNFERNYCKQCPSMLNKLTTQTATTDPAKIYKSEIAAMDCHSAYAKVLKPRNTKQVCMISQRLC